MIPDKIYLNIPIQYTNSSEMGIATWDTREWPDCTNIEYIRKEALIEWANEQIKVAKVNNLAYSPFEKLVDKLNEM